MCFDCYRLLGLCLTHLSVSKYVRSLRVNDYRRITICILFSMCSEMFVDTFCSVSFTAVERLGFVLRIKNRSDDLV